MTEHRCGSDCPASGRDHVMAYGRESPGRYWLDCSCGVAARFTTWQELTAWRDEHARVDD